jgi:HSP20 family protein
LFDPSTRAVGWPRTKGHEVVATEDWTPRIDIAETDKEFEIKAEMPKMRKEDVKVTVDNVFLTIRGERKQEKEEKGKNSIESSDTTEVSLVALLDIIKI